jgi:hypothetical protein
MIYEERKVTFTSGDSREPYSVRLVVNVEDGKPQTISICICSGQEALVQLSVGSMTMLNHLIVAAIAESDQIVDEYLRKAGQE